MPASLSASRAGSPHPALQAPLHLAPFAPPPSACCISAPNPAEQTLFMHWRCGQILHENGLFWHTCQITHPASQAHLHLAPFVPPCAACCPIAPDITALALIIYWKSCQSFPGQCIARSKAVCMCITSVNPTRQMHGNGIKELYVHWGLTLTTGCTTAGVQNLQNHSLPGVCLQWGV